jgi:predicted Zn finger-like uncharacterized protein
MLLLCPNCDARYLTPDDRIGPNGRRVRCARCAHVWFVELKLSAKKSEEPKPGSLGTQSHDGAAEQSKPEQASPSDNVVKIEPLPPSRVPALRTTRVRRSRAPALFLAIAIVFAFSANLVPIREHINLLWPDVFKSFESFELFTKKNVGDGEGISLSVENLVNEWNSTDAGLQLVIRGKIVNKSEFKQPAQMLRIRLYDSSDQKVRDMKDQIAGGAFGPFEQRPFNMIFADPGDVARALPTLEPIE